MGALDLGPIPNLYSPKNPGFVWGHLGMDYGSGGISLTSPYYNMTIAIAQNSYMGQNCSVDFKQMQFPFFSMLCETMKIAVNAIYDEVPNICGKHEDIEIQWQKLQNVAEFQAPPHYKLNCEWLHDLPVS